MSEKFIDITFPISSNLPKWPGSLGFKMEWHSKMPENINNTTSFSMDTHFGTHIDSPLHFVKEGKSIDELDLENLIGEVYVVEIRNTRSISSLDLDLALIPDDCKKLIIKTQNQIYWDSKLKYFQEDFVGLDHTGAQWIVNRGIHLIGIDYLSIQRFHDGPASHQILLENEVIILESLNLQDVDVGVYELICLPIRLLGFEGAPVRAILKTKCNG